MAIKKGLLNFIFDEDISLPMEEQKRRLYISSVADKYDSTYDALYENENLEDMIDNYGMGDKLIEKVEDYFETEEGKQFIKDWDELVGEPITSDREYKALAIALYL